jgi:hypothetical protein
MYGSYMKFSWQEFTAAAANYVKHCYATASRDNPTQQPCCSSDIRMLPADHKDILAEWVGGISSMEDIRQCRTTGSLSLYQLLLQYRHRLATDPRDKVVALLALQTNDPNLPAISMNVDYSLSTAEVYGSLVIAYLAGYKNLWVLEANSFMHLQSNLPTWAIDWTAITKDRVIDLRRAITVSLYNASAGMSDEFNFEHKTETNELTFDGRYVDTIVLVSRAFPILQNLKAFVPIIEHWKHMASTIGPLRFAYYGRETLEDTFARTMTEDCAYIANTRAFSSS